MVDDELKGIGIGGAGLRDDSDDEDASRLLDELEVGNLSDLEPEQLEAIFSAIGDVEELEGINQIQEGGDRIKRQAEQQVRDQASVERQNVFEAQLTEIQDIGQDTELLQRAAAEAATTNNLLEIANNLLENLIRTTSRSPQLIAKDANQVQFTRSNSARDVIDEDDITTSRIYVKANVQNEEDLFVGLEGVSVGNGFRLEPGEERVFPVDILGGGFQITAQEAGDQYTYLALGRA